MSTQFSIRAKTCTLKYNHQDSRHIILSENSKYIIPVYQRPYSWTVEAIQKFLGNIFVSFWGNDGHAPEDALFLGTMQLAEKDNQVEQEVIDGQQRLTTFLLLLRVLKLRFPDSAELQKIGLNWMVTKVNNGEQQKYLDEFLTSEITNDGNKLNPYIEKSCHVGEVLSEYIDDEENTAFFDIEVFTRFLLTNIYFVVVETKAGLSKTLQIFNAINTTGLDLNGGDIFKIRFYEYLTDKKGLAESVFDKISELYQKIDCYNRQVGFQAAAINDILSIYQYILIAKYDLPVVLYTYGVDTFFERLFDTLLNVNPWEHYRNNLDSLELSIEEMDEIIEARYAWENQTYASVEDACALHFIWQSRYGRYWILIFIFLYRFRGEKDHWNRMLYFTRQLSKLYFIYSVRFLRAINELATFTYKVVKSLVKDTLDSTLSLVNEKIGTIEAHQGYKGFKEILNGEITENAKMKNLICRMSAMLEENYTSTRQEDIDEIPKRIFEAPSDIEHIQSYHDKNGEKREDIWAEWQGDINAIGNLMILEQSMNRSIGNDPYHKKRVHYAGSSFAIVKNHAAAYDAWMFSDCLVRKEKEVAKIINYLFSM
ncbi:MAG TPA: DUF262 domain-containing HNH endonuclease family protein [Puia sp.]|nr:DUF262 domain-containing HNH endonuclease family protein [Puia sp.]